MNEDKGFMLQCTKCKGAFHEADLVCQPDDIHPETGEHDKADCVWCPHCQDSWKFAHIRTIEPGANHRCSKCQDEGIIFQRPGEWMVCECPIDIPQSAIDGDSLC